MRLRGSWEALRSQLPERATLTVAHPKAHPRQRTYQGRNTQVSVALPTGRLLKSVRTVVVPDANGCDTQLSLGVTTYPPKSSLSDGRVYCGSQF